MRHVLWATVTTGTVAPRVCLEEKYADVPQPRPLEVERRLELHARPLDHGFEGPCYPAAPSDGKAVRRSATRTECATLIKLVSAESLIASGVIIGCSSRHTATLTPHPVESFHLLLGGLSVGQQTTSLSSVMS